MRTVPLCAFVLFIAACSGGSSDIPPELEKAAAVIEVTLKAGALEQSSFPVVLPGGTPRQFVSWYFSDLGAAERPPSEDDPEAAEIPGIKMPLGVSFSHTAPRTGIGKQIVLKWDDARGVVIVEGYVDPAKQPVFVKEFSLPQVTAKNEMARLASQSLLEQGASYQAF